MKTWRRFRALSARDRFLIVESACLLLLVRISLLLFPFFLVRRCFHLVPQSRRGASSAPARRVAWSVTAAAAHLPLRTSCLVDALACETMLRRRGLKCDLRFGVQPPPAASGVLVAHSWIEQNGVVLVGAVEDLDHYRVLSSEIRQ